MLAYLLITSEASKQQQLCKSEQETGAMLIVISIGRRKFSKNPSIVIADVQDIITQIVNQKKLRKKNVSNLPM